MAGWLPKLEDELSAVDIINERYRKAEEGASRWTGDQVANLNNISAVYPWLSPGIAIPFARGGHGLDSPALLGVARLQGQMQTVQNRNPSHFPARARGRAFLDRQTILHEPKQQADLSALETLKSVDYRLGALTPEDRKRRELYQELAISDIDSARSKYGNVPASMLSGQALEDEILSIEREQLQMLQYLNQNPDDQKLEQEFSDMRSYSDTLLSQRRDDTTESYKSTAAWSNPLGYVADAAHYGMEGMKATARYGTVAMDAPYQAVQGTIRNLYDAALYSDPGDPREMIESLVATVSSPLAFAPGLDHFTPDWLEEEWDTDVWGQIDAAVILQDVFSGDADVLDTNYTGGGWFLDQDSEVSLERRENEDAMAAIDGKVVTMGRLLTSTMTPWDPEDTAYNIISGTLDGMLAVAGKQEGALDEVLALGSRAAARGSANAARRLTTGGAHRGNKHFGSIEEFNAVRNTDEYTGFLSYIWENRGRDDLMWHLRGDMPKMDQETMASVVRKARSVDADGGTLDDAVQGMDQILAGSVEMLGGSLPRITDPTATFKTRRAGRLGNFMSGTKFKGDSYDDAMKQTERFMRNLQTRKGPQLPTSVTRHYDRMAMATSKTERYTILYGVVDDDGVKVTTGMMDDMEDWLVSEHGWSREYAQRMSRGYEDTEGAARQTYSKNITNGTEKMEAHFGADAAELGPIRIASESIQDDIYLPDSRALAAATGGGMSGGRRKRWKQRFDTTSKAVDIDSAHPRSSTMGTLESDVSRAQEDYDQAVRNLAPAKQEDMVATLTQRRNRARLDLTDAQRSLEDARTTGTVKRSVYGAARGANGLAAKFTDGIWKTARLARIAWPIRVVAEEQMRMAGSGLTSMFKDPIGYISWSFGRKGATDVLDETMGMGKAFSTLEPETQWQLRQALNKMDRNRNPNGRLKLRHEFRKVIKGQDNPEAVASAWIDEIGRLGGDPVTERFLRGESIDDIVAWLRGSGRKQLDEVKGSNPNIASRLNTEDGVKQYVGYLGDRVDYYTGGSNIELRDLVTKGELRGTKLLDDATGEANPLIQQTLIDDFLDADGAPTEFIGMNRQVMEEARGGYARFTDNMFHMLGSVPTNRLSRNPAFKQLYWKEVERLAPYMTDDVFKTVMAQADKAGLSGKFTVGSGDWGDFTGRMRASRKGGTVADIDDVAALDEIAKFRALDESNALLMNLTERRSHWDAMRLVAPFGDAWEEVIRAWFHPTNGLIARRPIIGRRAEQAVTALKEDDTGQLFGENVDPITGEERGFVWRDPSSGEDIFVYPFSDTAMSMTGMPTQLVGRLAGMNMIGDVFPGIGPAITLPAQLLMPDRPEFDFLRETIMPYGEVESAVDLVAPTWATKAITAFAYDPDDASGWRKPFVKAIDLLALDPDWQNQHASRQVDALRWLISTGDVDTSTPEGMTDALEQSRNISTWTWMMHGVASMVSPTAPSPAAPVMVDGVPVPYKELQEVYRLYSESDQTDGSYRFLEDYGATLLSLMKGKSYQTTWGSVQTKEADAWVRQNQGIVDQYPDVGFMFAPQGGEFDQNIFFRWFEDTRKSMDPKDWALASGEVVADTIYWNQKRKLQNIPDGDIMLTQLAIDLKEQYPGWRSSLVTSGKIDHEDAIVQLRDAISDPRLRESRGGQVAWEYLKARDLADLSMKVNFGRSFGSSAQDVADMHRDMYSMGENLSARNASFRPMWSVLRREYNQDALGIV